MFSSGAGGNAVAIRYFFFVGLQTLPSPPNLDLVLLSMGSELPPHNIQIGNYPYGKDCRHHFFLQLGEL